jgi:hypothetical protein
MVWLLTMELGLLAAEWVVLVVLVEVVEVVLEATDNNVLLDTVARHNRWNNGFMIVPLCQKATVQWLLEN